MAKVQGSLWLRLLLPLVFVAGLAVVGSRFTELETAFKSMKGIDYRYMVLAFGAQGFALLAQAGVLKSSLALVTDAPKGWLETLRLSLGMEFMQIAVPSAGVSGAGFLASQGKADINGIQTSIAASVVYYGSGYAALALVSATASTLHVAGIGGKGPLILMTSLGVSLIVGLFSAPFLVLRFRKGMQRFTVWIATVWVRKGSTGSGVVHFWDEAESVARVALTNRKRIMYGMAFAIGVDAASGLVLWLCGLSVGIRLGLAELLVSYCVGTALAVFSVTPSGIGIMEPAMILALTRSGNAIGPAAAMVALFRIVGFWFPFLLGFIATIPARRKVHA